MKKTDNRKLWQPAPINGKDVDWGFITELISDHYADNSIAISEGNDAVAFFNSGNSITAIKDGNAILIQSFDEHAARTIAVAICTTINSCTDNGDLYAECDIRYWTIDYYRIRFYHTDPNH